MATNAEQQLILAETYTELTIGSRDFLGLPEPAAVDFNIYVPFDVNAVFAHEMRVPVTDDDAKNGEDNAQGMIGTEGDFQAAARTTYDAAGVMGAMASKKASFSLESYNSSDPDANHPDDLEAKVKDVICQLFLGVNSDALPSGSSAQGAVGHRTVDDGTTTVVSKWIHGENYRGSGFAEGASESWGKQCFTAVQFGEIEERLVALAKYQTDASNTEGYRKPLLDENDCIGIPIIIQENADNKIRVNYYLQQTSGL